MTNSGAAARVAAHDDPTMPAVRVLCEDTRSTRTIDFRVEQVGSAFYAHGVGPIPAQSGIVRYQRWDGEPWCAFEVVVVGTDPAHPAGEWRMADIQPDATWSSCPAWLRAVVEHLRPKDDT